MISETQKWLCHVRKHNFGSISVNSIMAYYDYDHDNRLVTLCGSPWRVRPLALYEHNGHLFLLWRNLGDYQANGERSVYRVKGDVWCANDYCINGDFVVFVNNGRPIAPKYGEYLS